MRTLIALLFPALALASGAGPIATQSPTYTGNVTVGTSLTASYATASTVPYFDASKLLVSSAVTPTELGYLSGVTSAIQTQIAAKAPSTAPTFGTSSRFSYATASTVPYWDSNKDLVSSAVTPTELGYLSGVTSAIQTQIGTLCTKAACAATGNWTYTGNITGDGGDSVSGFLKKRVAATATTITAAQCGSTFYNSGAVQMELPEASTVLGCQLTFIVANAANFDVNPDNADQILVLTNAAGDMIRSATLGQSITLEALSASEWVQVAAGAGAAWADAD